MADKCDNSDEDSIPPTKKTKRSQHKTVSKSPFPSRSLSPHEWTPSLPRDVCRFKLVHLDKLGIFYETHEISLNDLISKTDCYDLQIPILKDDFDVIVNFLKKHICFNVSHFKDPVHHGGSDGDKRVALHSSEDVQLQEARWNQDMKNVYQNLQKLREFSITEYLESIGNVADRKPIERMLANVSAASVDLLEMVIYFMEEERKMGMGFCLEMMYRELHSAFFEACGLRVSAGECVKKTLSLFSGGYTIVSSPDLRCLLDKRLSVHKTDTMTFVFSEKLSTVLVVGEVKRRTGERIESENFSLLRDLDVYDILGQHGAELLVESNDTCFVNTVDRKNLVFGIICAGTQVIFTALEISHTHFQRLTDCKANISDEEDFGRSFIFYTKPFDLLKDADRSSIYGPLLRLTCFQRDLKF